MAAPAVLKTLERAWLALQPSQLPMAVMGGLALSAWRYPRSTRDVDLLVAIREEDADKLLGPLVEQGFRPKRTPAIRPLGSMKILQLDFDPPDSFLTIPADLLLVDAAVHRAALDRRVPFAIPGVAGELFVLSCEDLLLFKLAAGRTIDLSDAAALLRANRERLDGAYLWAQAENLGVQAELRTAWDEACPDNPPAE